MSGFIAALERRIAYRDAVRQDPRCQKLIADGNAATDTQSPPAAKE